MKLPLIIDVRRRTLDRDKRKGHTIIDSAGVVIMHILPDPAGNFVYTQTIVDAVNGAGWRIDIDNAPKFDVGNGQPHFGAFLLSVEQEGGAVQLVGEAHRSGDGRFWWAQEDEEHRDVASSGWRIVAWRPLPAPAPRLPR